MLGVQAENKESLDAAYRVYFPASGETVIDDANEFAGMNGWIHHLRQESVRKGIHKDGSMVLVCDIDLLYSDTDSNTQEVMGEDEPRLNCIQAFGDMLSSGVGADCTIVVRAGYGSILDDFMMFKYFQARGQSIKAHRAILSARSAYFEGMFRGGGFNEARDGALRLNEDHELVGTVKANSVNTPLP